MHVFRKLPFRRQTGKHGGAPGVSSKQPVPLCSQKWLKLLVSAHFFIQNYLADSHPASCPVRKAKAPLSCIWQHRRCLVNIAPKSSRLVPWQRHFFLPGWQVRWLHFCIYPNPGVFRSPRKRPDSCWPKACMPTQISRLKPNPDPGRN